MNNEVTDVQTHLKNFAPHTEFNFHDMSKITGNNLPIEGIGADVGFGNLKVASRFGLHKVPSRLHYCNINDVESIEIKKDTFICYKEIDSDECVIIGDKAINLYMKKGKYDLNDDAEDTSDRLNNKEYIILLRVGLALGLMKENGDFSEVSNILLGVGLPEEDFQNDEEVEKLKKVCNGVHSFEIMIGDTEEFIQFNLDVKKTIVSSQPFGSLSALTVRPNGKRTGFEHLKSEGTTLTIDAGFGTLDTFYSVSGKKVKSRAGGSKLLCMSDKELSMTSIYNLFSQYVSCGLTDEDGEVVLKAYPKLRLTKKDIDKLLGGEVGRRFLKEVLDKQRVDLSPHMAMAIETVLEERIKILNDRYDDLAEVDNILLTGGLAPEIERIISKYKHEYLNIYVAENKDESKYITFDSSFANAVGYMNLVLKMALTLVSEAKKVKTTRTKEIAVSIEEN